MSGASHFLEHLLFKGTSTRSGRDIAIAIDAVGGDLNAFTSHEYTCYYAHVLAAEAQMAVELVCDVVLDASITTADVDVERQVILEEIAMRDDDPEDVLERYVLLDGVRRRAVGAPGDRYASRPSSR